MARWQLREPHYIRVDGTKWEYNEVDRITGRPKRTQFDVPLYINPEDEGDVKAFGQGEAGIVVCNGHNPGPRDVIFHEKDGSPGLPTPGMFPLDDEAREISGQFSKKWDAPQEGQPSYVQNLEEKLLMQMAELQAGVKSAAPAEGLQEMLATMTQMMAKQTEILAQLAARPIERRKVA